jgi:hypothetical protein
LTTDGGRAKEEEKEKEKERKKEREREYMSFAWELIDLN